MSRELRALVSCLAPWIEQGAEGKGLIDWGFELGFQFEF